MRYRRTVAAIVASWLLLGMVGTGLAYPRPGRTELISVAVDGFSGNSHSGAFSVSGDGRYVTFFSDASNLVERDVNGFGDVFVRDRATGTTELVSVSSQGAQGNNSASEPEISADGRYVAFWSGATNLVPGDGNARTDIFLRDLETGVTERVSVGTGGTEGNQHSVPSISMSPDGRYVAFQSFASNFAPLDVNSDPDVFLRDRVTGVTELVSRATDGALPNQASGGPDISADGRFVAFHSAATNLAPGDSDEMGPRESDVFVRDLVTGVTERVSVASDGSRANVGSLFPSISADGRYVAFTTPASNLVPEDNNGLRDVFVHDRVTGVTERVSVAGNGDGGDSTSRLTGMSADGRHVVFYSFSTNLVPGDTNATYDVFVHDRLTGTTERVSIASDGSEGDSFSSNSAISADGQFVAFGTYASNLVPGDTNGVFDTLIRDMGPSAGVGGIEVSSAGEPNVSGWATFNGEVVAAASDAEGDAPTGAADAGGDLTGATVVHRPEHEDLLVRMNVTRLPGVRWAYLGLSEGRAEEVPFLTAAGAPGVLYGTELRVGGIRYEVRTVRAGATSVPPAAPLFALHRCDPTCAEVARLAGGFGDGGDKVEVSVPLSALGATGETILTGMRAFTALGEGAPGSVHLLDQVSLPDATLRPPTVTLGIAPAGTPEDQVIFDTPAELAGGMFTGSVSATSFPAGEYEVWARACLGGTCGAASARVVS